MLQVDGLNFCRIDHSSVHPGNIFPLQDRLIWLGYPAGGGRCFFGLAEWELAHLGNNYCIVGCLAGIELSVL